MDAVLRDIRNFAVFESSKDFKCPENISNPNVLTTGKMVEMGVPNQFSKDFEFVEPNKFYGRDYKETHLVGTDEMFDHDQEGLVGMPYNIVFFGEITSFMDWTYEGCKVATFPDPVKMIFEREALQKRKAFHFINKKTRVCSCNIFRKCGSCSHSFELLMLRLVFKEKFGESIAVDICEA